MVKMVGSIIQNKIVDLIKPQQSVFLVKCFIRLFTTGSFVSCHWYTSSWIDCSLLTLQMLRLLSSNAQEWKYFWKSSEPYLVGIHLNALAEYSHMSTHMPGFQWFSGVLHYFVLAKLVPSSIRFNRFMPRDLLEKMLSGRLIILKITLQLIMG